MNARKRLRRVVIDTSDEEDLEGFEEENFNENEFDNEDEEQIEEDMMAEEIAMENPESIEVEDEPDFMDNSGQLWEFVCRIGDGQNELEEFVGQMQEEGGKLVEKEDNKKWRRFGCEAPNGDGGACPFQAIFLKSCFNLYSRGLHIHEQEMENEAGSSRKIAEKNIAEKTRSVKKIRRKVKRNYSSVGKKPSIENGQVFVNRCGKRWKFLAKINKNNAKKVLQKEFHFGTVIESKKGFNVYCQNKRKSNGGKCPYAGVYLRENGCLYTRGQHECCRKDMSGQTPAVGENYVDIRGKMWHFSTHLGKNASAQTIRLHNSLSDVDKRDYGFFIRCHIKVAKNKKCQFKGIYLNANGCLYTRGEHQHTERPIKLEKIPAVGDNYVDKFGKEWKFYNQIGKRGVSRYRLRNEFGFSCIHKMQIGFTMQCSKRGPRENCKFGGLYLRANGCLYTRGRHEHKAKTAMAEGNEEEPLLKLTNIVVEDNYLDHYGNSWPLVARIDKNLGKEEFKQKFGISRVQPAKYGFSIRCQKSGKNSYGRCRFSAFYVKSTGCLYGKSMEHDHPDATNFANQLMTMTNNEMENN